VDRAATTTSLHTVAEAARLMNVSADCVRRMVRAGQLVTVTLAGAAYERVTGASILALANRAPEQVETSNPDIMEYLNRPTLPGESRASAYPGGAPCSTSTTQCSSSPRCYLRLAARCSPCQFYPQPVATGVGGRSRRIPDVRQILNF